MPPLTPRQQTLHILLKKYSRSLIRNKLHSFLMLTFLSINGMMLQNRSRQQIHKAKWTLFWTVSWAKLHKAILTALYQLLVASTAQPHTLLLGPGGHKRPCEHATVGMGIWCVKPGTLPSTPPNTPHYPQHLPPQCHEGKPSCLLSIAIS